MRAQITDERNFDFCGDKPLLDATAGAILANGMLELAEHLPEEGILLQKKYVGELRKWLGAPENKPVEKNAKQVLTLGKLAGIEYGRKVFLNEGEGIILFLIGWDHT